MIGKHFKILEFYKGCEEHYQALLSGNIDPAWYISPLLVIGLDKLREKIDAPIIINSGFRTPEHNFSVGGKKKSMHLYGLAVDIYSPETPISDLYDAAKSVNIFKGIGRGKSFIHLDVRNSTRLIEWEY